MYETPASNGGRGLKLDDVLQADFSSGETPASNGGRGLKRPELCLQAVRAAKRPPAMAGAD